MNKENYEKLVLENYETEFSYEKNRSNLNITFNRIAFIFFVFLVICCIYSIKIFYLGSLNFKINKKISTSVNKNYRADIVDINGNFLVKTVNTINLGINPNQVIDKKKLLLNLRLIFPNKDFNKVKKKLNGKKFFYLDKQTSQESYDKVRLLGDKSIVTEKKLSRI